ncbi:hypothetical protein AQUCO_05400133v1 [Aquilegia coerulea]|uniref:Uncharacterized protein n=1 Tax=Aquilegia coerulea TaxID=218851 RepID=A0A2G5CHV8_AQUCA|nr:hypothetical protein AQUCO_05400133v1 [Aquilegia coerulea]
MAAETSYLFLLLLLLTPVLLLLLVLTLIVRPKSIKIPIKNRHVFITGGSSGIGLALAHQAASQGAQVSILARNQEKLEQARNSILLSTAVLPGMKKNRKDRGPGSIALMSSQAGQVGIYGYTAYAASKFGLRGLGEALQQELISENIHVSIICPPDTDTPGLVEENKGRPEVTKIIASSSGAMSADEVAQKALNGIKSGTFIVPCNFEGLLLCLVTAGLSPQRSPLMAFVEVVTVGVLRVAALFFQWDWYGSIAKWSAQKKGT